MDYHIIIPARYASQRLPGKPLLDIAGKPMIQRVVECAQRTKAKSVTVATDDERIKNAVEAFGGQVCMTRADHQSGTDRLQEVVEKMGIADDAIVVNVQGDEPLMPAAVIEQVARNLANNPQAGVATLCEPIKNYHDLFNPNIVKAVFDVNGIALYFSRAPIPWQRDTFNFYAISDLQKKHNGETLAYRHIGMYAYKVHLLNEFVHWPMAHLEKLEKLEQLRVLANGRKIHIEEACAEVPGGVDTQDDLDRVVNIIQELS